MCLSFSKWWQENVELHLKAFRGYIWEAGTAYICGLLCYNKDVTIVSVYTAISRSLCFNIWTVMTTASQIGKGILHQSFFHERKFLFRKIFSL